MNRRQAHTALFNRRPVGQSNFRVLWVSESIFNMAFMWDSVANRTPTRQFDHITATYGGNLSGAGLLELADETQAYVGGQWVQQTRREQFSSYSACVIQWGRNDEGAITAAQHRKSLDKQIAQALAKFPRVVLSNCPPKCLANLSAWDAATDGYINNGHKAEFSPLVTKWGVRSYDLNTNFTSLVTAGTYTVAQLMRDTVHPTATAGAVGTEVIAQAVYNAMEDRTAANSATPEITGRVVNYLFGQPTVGSWALITTTNVEGPTEGQAPRLTGGADQGLAISSSGAKLSFPSTQASQIWLHYYQRTGGGTFDAYVDRGTGSEVKTSINSSSALNNYPRSALIGSDLAAGTHTIELETTSANSVCILGVTVVGAP